MSGEVQRAPEDARRSNEIVEGMVQRLPQPWGRWAMIVHEGSDEADVVVGARADVLALLEGMAGAAGRPEVARGIRERIETKPGAERELALIIVCRAGWLLQWVSAIGVNSRGGTA